MGMVGTVGHFVVFVSELFTSLRMGRPRFTDLLENSIACLRLGWRPVVAVCAPFGMAFAFNFDSLLGVIGARAFAGGAIAPSVIRQAGPLVTATIMAAVVGAAFCADLGARTVRDEIAGMQVMGVNPIPRLVFPRVVATAVMAPILFLFATAAVIIGGFVLLVMFRSANAGIFIDGMQRLVEVRDIFLALFKTGLHGFTIGVCACYWGLRAQGGPAGVAIAVRKSIISSIIIVFCVDFMLTTLFYTT